MISGKSILAAALVACSMPAMAQQLGRPQDGFYSGQSNGQYSGQVDERVDGRGSRNEGLPPSAADKPSRAMDNPVTNDDCVEVGSLAQDARPGYQARVQAACQ